MNCFLTLPWHSPSPVLKSSVSPQAALLSLQELESKLHNDNFQLGLIHAALAKCWRQERVYVRRLQQRISLITMAMLVGKGDRVNTSRQAPAHTSQRGGWPVASNRGVVSYYHDCYTVHGPHTR